MIIYGIIGVIFAAAVLQFSSGDEEKTPALGAFGVIVLGAIIGSIVAVTWPIFAGIMIGNLYSER